mgnify:CR=1 FL=1
MNKNNSIGGITWGACMGTSLATCISWSMWHSLGWALVHGFLGWFYIIYYAIKY